MCPPEKDRGGLLVLISLEPLLLGSLTNLSTFPRSKTKTSRIE